MSQVSETTKGRIRVALVTRPATGGMRSHLTTLLSGLDRARFAPTLFAPEDFTLASPQAECPRYPLAIRSRTSPLADTRAILMLAHHLRGNFDLVHAHGLRGALIGVLAAQRAGIPALFTAHNLLPNLGVLPRLLLAHIGKAAASVLAVSQAVAANLEDVGIVPSKIVVVPNGIDLTPFNRPIDMAVVRAQWNIPTDAPLVVAVGRLAPEKGFDILIAAMRYLLRDMPAPRLALTGSGPVEADLRRQAKPEGDAIRFLGHQADIAPLLAMADVVAIPSRQEGQGIVALEAMAARRPVVASAVGGLRETIEEGQTGLLVPPEDAEALSAGLWRLLTDPTSREAMGMAGRQRVEDNYTAARMISRIEALYAQYSKSV